MDNSHPWRIIRSILTGHLSFCVTSRKDILFFALTVSSGIKKKRVLRTVGILSMLSCQFMWKRPSCYVTCLALSKIYHKFGTAVHVVLSVYVEET